MFNGKRVVMALIVGFASVACNSSAAYGQAVVADFPVVDQMTLNECNGEMVLLNGNVHQETNFSTSPNGNTHTSLNATVNLTGIGQTSGAYYVAKESTHNETNTKGIAQEQSFSTKIRLIAQGPTPDMVDRATLHVVIDKNGVVKTDISKHQISCK